MFLPPFLSKGDRIAIVSPARSITFADVLPAMKLLEEAGFEVVLGSSVFRTHHQQAGTDDERRSDLQRMLDDPSVKAILCSRGGYGTVRIVDGIDFSRFCANPKWIVGYSDITVLHAHVQQLFGIATLHATMPLNIRDDGHDESLETMIRLLTGQKLAYSFPRDPLCRSGVAEGELTGGNLSILCSLSGTISSPDTDGKILFLEDVDEYLYHIDRMMMNLRRSGKLACLSGLIVGGMTRMNDNTVPFGLTANEIIARAVGGFGYPVCFNFRAGHCSPNLALRMGDTIRLSVAEEVEVSFY